MNNSTSISGSVLIDTLKNDLLSALGIIFIVVGTIGTFLNLVLFTRPALWTLSPCIPYLLASSLATIPILYCGLLTRVLIGLQFTPFYYSQILCKLQIYVIYTSVTLSIWFMVACCWDRSVSSSRDVIIRQMSNMRTTRRIIVLITVTILVTYAQIFYCFQANLFSSPAPCSAFNLVCNIIDTCLAFILQLIVPTILLLFFGFKTFLNVNKSFRQHRIGVMIINQNRDNINISVNQIINNRCTISNNQHILPMLFVQVTLLILCTLPLSAFKLYTTFSSLIRKNNTRLSAENFIFNLIILMHYSDKIFAFYIYTITSRYFRQTLKKLIQSIRRRCANIF